MFRVEPMTLDDVAEVGRIERACFSNPWPASAYRRELRLPEQNYYIVLRETASVSGNGSQSLAVEGEHPSGGSRPIPRRTLLPLALGRRGDDDARGGRGASQPGPMVGFAGMWLLFDEAHITTIGVEPAHRGRYLGELLLGTLLDEALRRGAGWLTLEVRVSNEPAQRLYHKYGFTVQGTRRRYYSDNNEDAYIMWSASFREPDYLRDLARVRRELAERLNMSLPPILVAEPDPAEVPADAEPRPAVG